MLKRVLLGKSGITKVGYFSFAYCHSLSRVTIPDSVLSIDDYAFQYCHSLYFVSMTAKATSIGTHAFLNCYSISSLIIPDSVLTIGNYAFRYCYGVKEYHLRPLAPPSLSNANAFQGIPPDCIIYVPAGSLEAYKTSTNWSEYADQMQEELV